MVYPDRIHATLQRASRTHDQTLERLNQTEVISLFNHNKRKQRNEPIRIRTKYVAGAKRLCICYSMFEKMARVLLTNHIAYKPTTIKRG